MKQTIRMAAALVACVCLFSACGGTAAGTASGSTVPASSAASSGTEAAVEAGLYVDGKKLDADPIMTIDGNDVSFDLFRYYYLTTKAQVSQGDDTVWSGDDAEEQAAALLDYTEKGLLMHFAILKAAEEQNITLTDEESATIDTAIDGYKEQMGDDSYAEALKSQYYTDAVYRQMYKASLLMQKLTGEMYGDTIRKDVQENYVHAQHILIKFTSTDKAASHDAERAKAEEVLAKVKDGGDFDALMQEYNEDSGEPAEGYYFTTGRMVQEFEDAAFALKEGETSEIVETSYGYHILKRLPIEETYVNENLMTLMSQTVSDQMTADLTKLSDKMEVTYTDAYSKVAPDTVK